jgi:large subunit ribosomal protein L32
MAVPKKKKSKSKSKSRRATYLKLKLTNPISCSNCGSVRMSHTVCPTCGYYKNKIVINYSE